MAKILAALWSGLLHPTALLHASDAAEIPQAHSELTGPTVGYCLYPVSGVRQQVTGRVCM